MGLLISSVINYCKAEEVLISRNPRLYYVSTTTSTSTLSTSSVCFVQFATGDQLLICGRKKRNIPAIDDKAPDMMDREHIHPAPVDKLEEVIDDLSEIADVTSSKQIDSREEKFLNYWMTTTVTWTYTSYTATSSIASVYCTPPTWTDANCPANG